MICSKLEESTDNLIANWDQVPDYLYHATLWDNLDEIQRFGLGKVTHSDRGHYDPLYQDDGFFVSYDPDDAAMYLSDYEPDDVVVLQIPKRILDPGNLYYDTNNEDNIDNPTSWYYKGVIRNPQRYVKIVD